MSKQSRRLKLIFYLNIVAVVLLVIYKIYLNFFERDFSGVHAEQLDAIQERLRSRSTYSFAVVGNINNSVGIFERKIIPMLNNADIDFVVSAGNAVSGSGEDKYRALYRTLERLEAPYLLTPGTHETQNFGRMRFYRHFGPFFYTFTASDSLFVFLDSTDPSSYRWQLRWLEETLTDSSARRTFVFIAHPLHPHLLRSQHAAQQQSLLGDSDATARDIDFRNKLLALFERYRVDAVFSSHLDVYSHQVHKGTHYVTSGGAGGLMFGNGANFHYYVEVTVAPDEMDISLGRLNIAQHPLFRTLESLWFFVHSLFYVGRVNFLLLLCVLVSIAIYLYNMIFVDRDYYPDFDLDPTPFLHQPLRVAMLTNNYLPFIGGVPVSIDRLKRGLQRLRHTVLVVAPRYSETESLCQEVKRIPSLLAFGKARQFRLANIFLPRIGRALAEFRPDVIHLHHPVWMGSVGMFWARRLNVATVYTYHTRLEHYSHFVLLPPALFRNLISHYLIKRFANKCDGVIVPTRSAAEYLRLIGVKTDLCVQPTGVDIARFENVSTDAVSRLRKTLGINRERVFISVSRLSREKNIDFMLDAVCTLKQAHHPPFRFVIVGDGDERQRLQQRVVELKLEEDVLLVGAVSPEDMPLYYSMSDVFLFASKSETQGLVVLEAMAAGLPVVAVRSSGIEDFVRDNVNGFKTPANIALWRQKVELLLQDDALLTELSTNARSCAQHYSIEAVAANTAEFYAHVLAGRAANRQ